MTKFISRVLLALGASALVGVAFAVDYGWNPSTGLEAFHGSFVSQGTAPVISGCATVSAQVGGATAGKFQSTNVACSPTLTFLTAAPNGWLCNIQDQVTTASKINQTSFTTTTAVFTNTGATTSGDTYVYFCIGF